MSEPLASESAPILCMTPLYNFSSDVNELPLGLGTRVSRYDRDDLSNPVDEIVGKHLEIHEPDFLLWHDPLRAGEIRDDENVRNLFQEKRWMDLMMLFLGPTTTLFRLLRLFKPGRLRAGETFVLFRDHIDDFEHWTTLGKGRASAMAVDYAVIAARTASYELLSVEIPFLTAFLQKLSPTLGDLTRFPEVELALNLYSSDNGEGLDVISTFAALEALLTKKDENEGLTYRLSMRTANFLGSDPESRKTVFREVKQFYNLRSKLVHGAPLDTKLMNRLSELESLRETLRRVLLSRLALLSEGEFVTNLPELLDECALDDQKRREVQAHAEQFLHIFKAGPG